MSYPFLKGHGTENDFVLLPDHDGSVHGDLSRDRVRALCDRRAGIGGDGVLRVIRTEASGFEAHSARTSTTDRTEAGAAEWFMDYRNADGSVSEMCGNGIRVFARHLVDEGLATSPMAIATRDGVKTVIVERGVITVDMGTPVVGDFSVVGVGHREWAARFVDMGNPHAVAFVDSLDDAGPLLEAPDHDRTVYPHGANVEFVVRRGAEQVAMRVHERGSGETRSCGTGACAAMVATALADGQGPGSAYTVDVPGGRLGVEWTQDDRVLLSGPAVVVARGMTDL